MWWKYFLTCRCLCWWKKGTKGNQSILHQIDEDIQYEIDRVHMGEANGDLIVINDLTKRYPDGKLAVDNLCLGIPSGQCFGLLGINGAGKTTTMAMLTAEFPPTSGDATLEGFSVTSEPEQTRRRIGYCPQFDAHFMNMTGREHVKLYASIKGVPANIIEDVVSYKLQQVGLNEYDSNRLSSNYSGGMKRKLSVACATIGNPRIIFLDEPSTGMDPVSRRDLWGIISAMVVGDGSESSSSSIILTTHSMEECEALCPRIGIMAGGRLKCLGSAQHLKSRYGKGFQVECKIKEIDVNDNDFVNTVTALTGRSRSDTSDIEVASDKSLLKVFTLDAAIAAVETLTGDKYLSQKINTNDPSGYVVYKNAKSTGVSSDELAVFCVDELRMKALLDFFTERFPNCILHERQDAKVRFELPSEGISISSIFSVIEESKEVLKLSDYGVSQTSLEQVFNMHAAVAEKEKEAKTD
jgi:ABC-type multidrug transport system ATPase subunit